MLMRGIRMSVRLIAVLLCGVCVHLGFIVLAGVVVMCGLAMVMGGCLVVGCRIMVMFA